MTSETFKSNHNFLLRRREIKVLTHTARNCWLDFMELIIENPYKEIDFVLSLNLKLNFLKSDEKSDAAAKMLKEEGNKNYKLKDGFRWSRKIASFCESYY